MPSFDVVSEVDLHEVTNAVDQTNREVGNRFDFKGSDARVEQNEAVLTLYADNEFQIRQVLDILYTRMSKRGIDVAALSSGQVQTSGTKASLAVTGQHPGRQGTCDRQEAGRFTEHYQSVGQFRPQTAVTGREFQGLA